MVTQRGTILVQIPFLQKNVRIFRMQGNKNNLCKVTLEHARSD